MKKLAIITGARGGIGQYLVKEFLSSGYFVIGIDCESKAAIEEDKFCYINFDLAELVLNEQAIESLQGKIEGIVGEWNPRVTLINNAALQVIKPVEKLSVDDLKETFAVNVHAPTILFQILSPRLLATKGAVLNFSSIHTKLTKPEFAVYAASKSALESMTRSWAIEYAKAGIAINALSPAAVDTPMLRDGFSDNTDLLLKLNECHPAGHIGDPEKLAALARTITELRDSFLAGSVIDYSGAISSRLCDPQ